jgi:hypothetical protein
LIDVLQGISDEETIKKINEFKLHFKSLPLTDQGTPKRVNKLTYYEQLIKVGKGNRVPGHVRAALNWNSLRKMNSDKLTMQITDGMKCIVCQLNNNALGMTSVEIWA